MRNTIRIPVLAAAALAFLPASGHELKDVSLIAAGGQAHLKLAFAPGPGEGDYPLYFQKSDAEKGTLTLSFLDAETAFPLGRHALDANAPEVEELLLKKITSPSGKNFLGIEIKLRKPPLGDAPIQGAPKGVLKVMFGKAPGKFTWSLSKAMRAGDDYLSAKAEAPPGGAKAIQASARSAEPAAPPVPAEPSIPGREEAMAPPAAAPETDEPEAKPMRLVEVKLLVTATQEDLLLVFDPPGTPNHHPRKDPQDPAWMELTLDGTASGLAKKEYPLPRSTVYKRIKVAGKPGKLVLKVLLAEGESPQVLPQESGLALSALGKGDAAPAFKWSSLKPAGVESENVADSPDGIASAHADGQALEAGRGGGKAKGLSSSRVFTPAQGGKDMVLTRDSAALRTDAGAGKVIRKIPVGEKVERIDAKGGSLKVVAGADTGWIKAADAVYEDELTQAQEQAIQGKIAAKQAKLDAAAAKQAAAEAMAAEKARKAEEAAAEAERKLAEKQAAKEAKLAAKQAAKAEAEAAHFQEAAATTRTGAGTAGDPSTARPGQGQGAAGAPKLGLADNPELANKLAQEKLAAEEEKKRIEPEENRVSYNSFGRRDPFIPVEQGASDNGIDIDQMKVVGIIWQASQPMAVLEHNKESGVSFTVKEGDPVHNGRVARISSDAVTFDISEYGISRSYSLRLVSHSTKEGAKK